MSVRKNTYRPHISVVIPVYKLDICRGNWVVIMDCDLQDRPEEISRLYTKVMTLYYNGVVQGAIRHLNV